MVLSAAIHAEARDLARKLTLLSLQYRVATEDIDVQDFIRDGGDYAYYSMIQSLRAVGIQDRQLELLVRETLERNALRIRQDIAVAMERVLELRRLHPDVERLGIPVFNIPLL